MFTFCTKRCKSVVKIQQLKRLVNFIAFHKVVKRYMGNSGRQTKVFDKNNVVSARMRLCSPQNSQKLAFYGTAYAKRRNAGYRNRFAFSKAGRTANTVNG